jgi:hypothetical protein
VNGEEALVRLRVDDDVCVVIALRGRGVIRVRRRRV